MEVLMFNICRGERCEEYLFRSMTHHYITLFLELLLQQGTRGK